LPGADEATVVQPGAPLPASCARCGAEVPEGVGRCPGCGTFQKDNVESVVHGLRSKKLAKIVDAYRVDLIDQLFAERGGRDALDVVSRISVENYALVCAQHKTIEARLDADGLFTQTGRRRSAFDMLKSISETIDRLRAELPPPITRSTTYTGVDAMPLSALERARDLLNRQIAGEPLTDRELGQLDVLMAASHGKVLLPPDESPAFHDRAGAAIVDPVAVATSPAVSEPDALNSGHGPEPVHVPTCGCGRPRTTDPRAERPHLCDSCGRATAEMYLMVGQPIIDRWPR
jgi:hypothetical protein